MKEQIAELIKLLNQGIKQLPPAMTALVRQYSMRSWVEATGLATLMLVMLIASVIFFRKGLTTPRLKDHYTRELKMTSEAITLITIGMATTVLAVVFMLLTLFEVANAVSPIYGLINSIK